MINLANKIIAYLGRTPDFREEVILQNDTGTDYIKEWNATDKPKPTDAQLDALASEATKLANNNVIRNTRRLAYGDIGDQLDLLYKDIVANKLDTTGEWAKAVKKVKDDNPKS